MEESCFKDNNVGVSNVVVFGNQLIDTRNYVQNSNGTLCGFASVFENLEQFDRFSPICVGATERGCQASTTPQPTTIPSAIPTGYPTFAPTKASSHAPTPVSSQQPSMIPADTPSLTKYPTGAPTRSHAPSTEPPNQGRDVTSSANTFYSSALSTLLLGCVYYLLL